jgi:hypothetical protein
MRFFFFFTFGAVNHVVAGSDIVETNISLFLWPCPAMRHATNHPISCCYIQYLNNALKIFQLHFDILSLRALSGDLHSRYLESLHTTPTSKCSCVFPYIHQQSRVSSGIVVCPSSFPHPRLTLFIMVCRQICRRGRVISRLSYIRESK